MTALSEELKQEIIREEPGGLWLILHEETPSDAPSIPDLLCDGLDQAQA